MPVWIRLRASATALPIAEGRPERPVDSAPIHDISCGRSGSSMKRWKWFLLIFELLLFAVVLILPQVDLPDFTVHGATAPVAAKMRLSTAPVPVINTAHCQALGPQNRTDSHPVEPAATLFAEHVSSRLSLLCTLIC